MQYTNYQSTPVYNYDRFTAGLPKGLDHRKHTWQA